MLNEPHGAALKVGPHATGIVEPRQARKGATVRRPSRVPWEYLTGADPVGRSRYGPFGGGCTAFIGLSLGDESSYQVLARKWRPQTFEAVVGQDPITRTLRNALASGRIAHAYLFAGPRGIGKTTTARLLARALLCLARTGPEPCGTLRRLPRRGHRRRHRDRRRLQSRHRGDPHAAREREVRAHARPLQGLHHRRGAPAHRGGLQRAPEDAGGAASPRGLHPGHHRSARHPGHRALARPALRLPPHGPRRAGAARSSACSIEEKIPFDPAALPPLVRAASGSLRDALSLLDTAIAYGDGRLEADTAAGLLGTTAPAEVKAYAAALVAHDTVAALEAIDRAAREGEDLHAFIRDVDRDAAPGPRPEGGANHQARRADLRPRATSCSKLGEPVSLDEILYILRALLDADEMMRESPHPRVELEIATVRATRRPVPAGAGGGAAPRGRGGGPPARRRPRRRGIRAGAARAAEHPRTAAGAARRPKLAFGRGRAVRRFHRHGRHAPTRRRAAAASREPAAAPAGAPERGAPPAPPSDLAEAWQRVTEEVNRKRALLGAVLAQVRPAGVERRCPHPRARGQPVPSRPAPGAAEPGHPRPGGAPLGDRGRALHHRDGRGDGRRGPRAHPAVQAAIAEFQGEIVAVRARSPEGDAP